MIIKGLFRRYKRWNPVHPTYGAFYGMGFGVGCGVGWGPGFGPEVVGYVGAGCGVGFNVGITLAGFGIGLPANVIFAAPYNAFLATKSSALKLARSGTQTAEDVWIRNVPLVSDFQREAGEKFSCFRQKYLSINGTDFFDVKNNLPLLTTSACKNIQAFHDQFFPRKGRLIKIRRRILQLYYLSNHTGKNVSHPILIGWPAIQYCNESMKTKD